MDVDGCGRDSTSRAGKARRSPTTGRTPGTSLRVVKKDAPRAECRIWGRRRRSSARRSRSARLAPSCGLAAQRELLRRGADPSSTAPLRKPSHATSERHSQPRVAASRRSAALAPRRLLGTRRSCSTRTTHRAKHAIRAIGDGSRDHRSRRCQSQPHDGGGFLTRIPRVRAAAHHRRCAASAKRTPRQPSSRSSPTPTRSSRTLPCARSAN